MKIVYTFFIKLPLIALVTHTSRLRSLAAPACARAPGSGCASPSRRFDEGVSPDQRRDIPKRLSLEPFSCFALLPVVGTSPSPLEISMSRASCSWRPASSSSASHTARSRGASPPWSRAAPAGPEMTVSQLLGADKLRHDVVLPAHAALAALFSHGQLATG